MTNLTRGQEFTHNGSTYTFSQYWTDAKGRRYIIARWAHRLTVNIPLAGA